MNARLCWCSVIDVNNANYPSSLITFHGRLTDVGMDSSGSDRCLMKFSAHSVSRSHEYFYGIFHSVSSGILWPFELHSVYWIPSCCSNTPVIAAHSQWQDRTGVFLNHLKGPPYDLLDPPRCQAILIQITLRVKVIYLHTGNEVETSFQTSDQSSPAS